MTKRKSKYTVILENKKMFRGTVDDIVDFLHHKGMANAEDYVIRNRVRRYGIKQKKIPIEKLTYQKMDHAAAATYAWDTMTQRNFEMRGGIRYEGVEGFNKPVTATFVWNALVNEKGKTRPAKKTIHARLRRGHRSLEALLCSNMEAQKEVIERRRKNREKINKFGVQARDRMEEKRKIAKQLEREAISKAAAAGSIQPSFCPQLPPMKDYVPKKMAYIRPGSLYPWPDFPYNSPVQTALNLKRNEHDSR